MDAPETTFSQGTPVTVDGDDSPKKGQSVPNNLYHLQAQNDSLLAELHSLRASYHTLEVKYEEAGDDLAKFQMEREEDQKKIDELAKTVEGLLSERDGLRDEMRRAGEREELFERRIDDAMVEKEGLEREIYEGMREREELVRGIDVGAKEKRDLMKKIEAYKTRNMEVEKEKREIVEGFSRTLEIISTIKESMVRIIESLDEEQVENAVREGEKSREPKEWDELLMELSTVSRMAERVEEKLTYWQEKTKKEKEELEDEKREIVEVFSRSLESISTTKESMVRIIDRLDEEKVENEVEESEEMVADSNSHEKSKEVRESNVLSMELNAVLRKAKWVEEKLKDYQEKTKKEKRELENSVVSLTEENRDINTLLRIALVEKEAVEKSLNKLKGNNEQRRVALLQIAERGLQKVGFGFMMGAAPSEQPSADNTSSNASNVDDSSECEEEVVSLASTVEKIMKNLRSEITQLRRSLEESGSDIERLQSLTEKQAQQIAEQAMYIKELEDREIMLTENVEELLMEIKAAEEEVARWREACELEAKAGQSIAEERDKVTAILKQELEKSRAALEISNGKLKLKEELAAAAMAAQAAAERSLQLADSRSSGLRERIEELTRQLEEAESRERNSRRVRLICWPWRTMKVNPASAALNGVQNVRPPEMQALLH
ncbi:hypothetical protein Nepgr_020234 [Nepenthes gracilis]|uniref:Uncharacterized protein n=1 Tax=Nepenthes gracilis TaxID=150966 RepID=A0AAD3SUL2_NEPGR|nr:hypothetical protein Nepgr_020234 [Nepenthes gracilis]